MSNRNLEGKLVEEWIDNLTYVNEHNKDELLSLCKKYYGRDIKELFLFNEALYKRKDHYRNDILKLIYLLNEDSYLIKCEMWSVKLSYDDLKDFIQGLICILDETLPIGTVVELKKNYLSKLLNGKKVNNAEVIIINRMIFHKGVNAYFDYAAIVYPIGFVKGDRAIHFTTNLIDKVVYRGYSDEKEDTYIYLLKRELIIQKKMKSFAFATDKDRKDYFEMVNEG